jgi:hypothetical protein
MRSSRREMIQRVPENRLGVSAEIDGDKTPALIKALEG